MINVSQKVRDAYFDYIHSTTELNINREMTNFKKYLNCISNSKIDSVSMDDKLLLFSEKLTGNNFSADYFRAAKAYGDKNVDIFYSQKTENLSSCSSDGELLLEMFIDEGKNLALKSISIKEPLNSRHTVSDFLVFSKINNLFLYEPDMFSDTILGRMYTGDVLLKYTENLLLSIKVKITVKPDFPPDTQGYILKAKYNDGILDIKRNVDIKESRDSVLNLSVYEANFDWLEVVY